MVGKMIGVNRTMLLCCCLISAIAAGCGNREAASRPCKTKFFAEIPLSTTYANGNMWTGWAGRWADSLLTIDRDAGFPPDTYYRVTLPSMLTTLGEMVSYGLDGATFNCDRTALLDLVDKAKAKGGFPCMFVGSLQAGVRNADKTGKTIKRNCGNPYGWYAADGRQIFVSYWTDRVCTPEQLAEWLKARRSETGDFIFVPDLAGLASLKWKTRTEEEMKDYIRSYLRVADGLYFGEYIACRRNEKGENVFDVTYYRDVLLKRIADVMNEPEFRGKKLLGLVAGLGHGNPSTFGNNLGQDGTRTLRRSFEADMSLEPDFINFFEWDEWNENTLIRPSVWNSFACKRLIRALIRNARCERNEPLAGDDIAIPNVILSYRKTLIPGELAIFELLSLPEHGTTGTATVQLRLTRPDGSLVREFDPVQLDLSKMDERRIEYPAEDVANEVAVVPELTITGPRGVRRFENGIPQIEIVPGGSSDHKWAMVSLRDIASDAICRLDVVPTDESGIYAAKVSASSAEEIDRVEVAVNGALVYSKGGDFDDFRTTSDYDVFSVTAFAKRYTDFKRFAKARPKLTVEGVSNVYWRCAGKTVHGTSLEFVDFSNYTPDSYLRIRKGEARNAVLKFDWPAFNESRVVPLKDVLDHGVFASVGANGYTFAVSRFYGMNEYGTPANAKSLSASALVRADRNVSVVSAYLVTKSGKMFRSRPAVVGERGKKVFRRIYSATGGCAKNIRFEENRQPPLSYDFASSRGVVVQSGAGCAFDGTLGAILYVATHRNRCGCSFYHSCPEMWNLTPSCAPALVKEGDSVVAEFDGTGKFFAIPWGAVSRMSAFRIAFDFKVEDAKHAQEIFSCGISRLYGGLAYVAVEGGALSSVLCGQADDHTYFKNVGKVKSGEWNHVEFTWDVDTAELTLNGESSGIKPCVAPLRYDCAAWFGGRKDRLFKGRLKNVRIDYL